MIDQYMIAFLTNGASDTGRGCDRPADHRLRGGAPCCGWWRLMLRSCCALALSLPRSLSRSLSLSLSRRAGCSWLRLGAAGESQERERERERETQRECCAEETAGRERAAERSERVRNGHVDAVVRLRGAAGECVLPRRSNLRYAPEK
jgi:hypothetical protein